MAIAYIGSSQGTQGTGAGTLTPTLPTGIEAGDLLVLAVNRGSVTGGAAGPGTHTLEADGWTVQETGTYDTAESPSGVWAVLTRIATAGQSAPVVRVRNSVSGLVSAGPYAWGCIALRSTRAGFVIGGLVSAAGAMGSGTTTGNLPTLPVTGFGGAYKSAVVWVSVVDGANATHSGWSGTVPAPSEVVDTGLSGVGYALALGMAYGFRNRLTTDISARTVTLSASANPLGVTLSVEETPSRLKTDGHRLNRRGCLLVDVERSGAWRRGFSGGPVVVEDVGWGPFLERVGPIQITGDGRRGSVAIDVLQDPEAPWEDDWTDADPPEGATVQVRLWYEGDPLDYAVPLFWGVLDAIEDLSHERVRFTAVTGPAALDARIGDAVNATDYPDAPDESLGRFLPIVFDEALVEAVPLTTVARSTLAAIAVVGDTVITVEDGSDFPSSGTVLINGVAVAFSAKSGNDLTVTTLTRSFGVGATVVEETQLDLAVHWRDISAWGGTVSHVYAASGKVLRELANPADFTIDFPGPTILEMPGGWPTVTVPSGAPVTGWVEMEAAGAGNNATNPTYAAAGHADWTERNYASVSKTTPVKLELERTSAVPDQGTILRVWALVEYAGDTVPDALATADTLAFKCNGTTLVSDLLAAGNMDADLRELVGLGATRSYAVDNPSHTHPTSTVTYDQKLDTSELVGAGSLTNQQAMTDLALHEGGTSTYADTDAGTLPIDTSFPVWGQDGIYVQLTLHPEKEGGHDLVRFRARVKLDPEATGNAEAIFVVAGSVVGSKKTWTAGAGVSTEDFSWHSTTSWADMYDPETGVIIVGKNKVYEVWYEVECTTTEQAQTQDSAQDHTVASMYLAAITDWANFTNAKLSCEYTGSASAVAARIVRMAFLVEYVQQQAVVADRILATVEGYGVATTSPYDALTELVEGADFAGETIDPVYLETATVNWDGDAGLSYVVTDQVTTQDLLSRILDSIWSWGWWHAGQFRVKARDLAADAVVEFTLRAHDLLGVPRRRRTTLVDVVNRLEVRWGNVALTGSPQRFHVDTDAGSQTAHGVRLVAETNEVLGTSFGVARLVDLRLDRRAYPRWIWTLALDLSVGLELEPGTIVALDAAPYEFTKGEVVGLDVRAGERDTHPVVLAEVIQIA